VSAVTARAAPSTLASLNSARRVRSAICIESVKRRVRSRLTYLTHIAHRLKQSQNSIAIGKCLCTHVETMQLRDCTKLTLSTNIDGSIKSLHSLSVV
jgi:hypothetical protein